MMRLQVSQSHHHLLNRGRLLLWVMVEVPRAVQPSPMKMLSKRGWTLFDEVEWSTLR